MYSSIWHVPYSKKKLKEDQIYKYIKFDISVKKTTYSSKFWKCKQAGPLSNLS